MSKMDKRGIPSALCHCKFVQFFYMEIWKNIIKFRVHKTLIWEILPLGIYPKEITWQVYIDLYRGVHCLKNMENDQNISKGES